MAAGVTDWRIRRAGLADAASLARIQIAGWRAAYDGIVPAEFLAGMDTPERVERWQSRVRAPDPTATFVALDEQGTVAAFCSVGALRTNDGKNGKDGDGESGVGELMTIYVDPPRYRSGAGRAVHDAGIDHLVRHGFQRAVLWVFTANERRPRVLRVVRLGPGRRHSRRRDHGQDNSRDALCAPLALTGESADLAGRSPW